MESIQDIFDEDTQSGSGDLDTDLAHAGHVLQKLAEEDQIDLSSLSDKDIADLTLELMPQAKTAQQKPQTPTQETRKEAAAMSTEQTPKTPQYADVAVELSKIAAAKGIDLTKVSEEDFKASFNELADRMSDPNYAAGSEQAKIAAQEEAEKRAADAAAFSHGERIADGFLARIKQAEDDESKKHEAEEKAKKEKEEAEKKASAASEIGSHGKAMFGAAKDVVKKHMGAAQDKGKHLLHAVGEHGKAHKGHYAAGAGGAAAGAAGTAAAMSRKKEALDEAALKIAREIADEMGIDPDTGKEKVAAAAPTETTTELTADEVGGRAIEMLKEAGYLPKE